MNQKSQEDKLKSEINKIKNWLQVWVINKERGAEWRKLMEKELK